jgi:Holliday junction resolvase RusA-like endonuclease
MAVWLRHEYWVTPNVYSIPGSPTDKPVILTLKFGFIKPKTNKKKHHTQKPDLSNLIKLVEDAGNGILWVDDSQIIQLQCEKFWAEFEGIEITVEVVNETL